MQVIAKHRETGRKVEGRLIIAALAIGKSKAIGFGLNPQQLGIMEYRSFSWYELDKMEQVIKTKEANR